MSKKNEKKVYGKADVIEQVARQTGIPKKDVKQVIDVLLNFIATEVKEGNEVRFRQFGKFYFRETKARRGHNPKTGEEITIPAQKRLGFKSLLKF